MTVIPQQFNHKQGEETSSDLYPETVGLAVWILVYTFISSMCALFTHILFRLNKQKAVYVSLMCFSIFLQQCVTMIQQAFSLARWRALQEEVYRADIDMWRNPKASIVYMTNPAVVMRIIFAIRVYFFNVESLLFFFWSLLLCLSLWEVKWRWARSPTFIIVSRYICFILPGLQAMAISLPPVKEREILHLVLTDCIMVTTVTCGIVFLILVLAKLVIVAMSKKRAPSMRDDRRKSKSNKEDRWLMLRFLISFFVLVALQTSFLYSQYDYAVFVMELRKPDAPFPYIGWTKNEQLKDWAYYMAGSSTGILIALVFATTPESRSQAKKLWRMNCSGFRAGKNRKSGNGRRLSSPIPPPLLLDDEKAGMRGYYEDNHIPIILEQAYHGKETGGGYSNRPPSEKSSQYSTTQFDYYDHASDPYQTIPLSQSPPPVDIAQAHMFLAFPEPAASANAQTQQQQSSYKYQAYRPPQSARDNTINISEAIMPTVQDTKLNYRESSYRSFGTGYENFGGMDEHVTDLSPPPPLHSTTTAKLSSKNPASDPVSPQEHGHHYVSDDDFDDDGNGRSRRSWMNGIVSPLTPDCDAFPPHAAFMRKPSVVVIAAGGGRVSNGSVRMPEQTPVQPPVDRAIVRSRLEEEDLASPIIPVNGTWRQ